MLSVMRKLGECAGQRDRAGLVGDGLQFHGHAPGRGGADGGI